MESGPFSGVVVAAGLAFLALRASAAGGQDVPPGYVDTPVGQVRESAIRGLCDIPVVFIGKVATRKSRRVDTRLGPSDLTDLTFDVERALRGSVASRVTITVLDGSVGTPRPESGRRYVIGFFGEERVHAVTGETYLGPVVRIDEEVELPTARVILDAWNDSTEKAVYCR
ncbi:MAG: hypothetical protein KC656_04555 [Myxococcales bacterium]|nr:hypothetical protein [Myxococcales bacterium]